MSTTNPGLGEGPAGTVNPPGRDALPTVDTTRTVGRVDDAIYGHFLESSFFGNIEDGVFDEGSPLAITDAGPLTGMRSDVLELVRDLQPGPIRWPGGNFTSAYHWEDGIGPRDERPSRMEPVWNVIETNRFGTDEFLAWCEAVGAEPYLVNSCRDIDEAIRWMEYTNSRADTALTRRRAAHGRQQPWGVHYWGIGNEVYGRWQMGHRSAEQYAADAREHARFMRSIDPEVSLIGVGDGGEHWTRELLAQTPSMLDYVSLHRYGLTPAWAEDDYDQIVAQSLYMEREITRFAHLVADAAHASGWDRPPAIALDEWTMRHVEPRSWPDPQADPDGGTAPRELPPVPEWPDHLQVNRWSPRTIADALFSAGVLHAAHRSVAHDVPVAMANPVNLVNANGLVVARPGGAFRSALYHVWHLYARHTGRIVLASEVDGPARSMPVRLGISAGPEGEPLHEPMAVPLLDVSVTRAEDGSIRAAVINRSRADTVRLRPVFDRNQQSTPTRARVRTVGAGVEDLGAGNSLSRPDHIDTRELGEVDAVDGTWAIPPHSVTVLTFKGAAR